MNLLSASSVDGRVRAGDLELEIAGAPSGELVVGVRPEALRFSTGAADEQVIQVRTEVVELLGHETIVYGSVRGHRVAAATTDAGIPSLPAERASLIARLEARRQPAVGETITLAMQLEDVHLFDAGSGEAVAPPNLLSSQQLAGS
jgi:multiple sugar transport system ATP-binding protein